MVNHFTILQSISSREIAAISKKQHRHLLQSIRKMEITWQRINGSIFRLVEYIDAKGQKRPEYLLSKKESLYIATKFSDEARVRLVNRWEELEIQQSFKINLSPSHDQIILKAIHILTERVRKQQKLLSLAKPKINCFNKLILSKTSFSATEVAADYGLSAIELNKILIKSKVIRIVNGQQVLYSKYLNKGYEYMAPTNHNYLSRRQLKWTELGRAFIYNLMEPTLDNNPEKSRKTSMINS